MKENAFTKWWAGFSEKHPGAAKWIREGGLFFLFSNLVTMQQLRIYEMYYKQLGLLES